MALCQWPPNRPLFSDVAVISFFGPPTGQGMLLREQRLSAVVMMITPSYATLSVSLDVAYFLVIFRFKHATNSISVTLAQMCRGRAKALSGPWHALGDLSELASREQWLLEIFHISGQAGVPQLHRNLPVPVIMQI